MISFTFQFGCMFPYFHFHSYVVVTAFKKNTLLLIPSCSFSFRFTICHKTEVVKNTLNPVWQPFTIPVRALCNGDYDRYESPCSSHLLIHTAAVYLFTAAFGCFYLPPHLHLRHSHLQYCHMVANMVGLHRIHTQITQTAERLQFLYFCIQGVWWITSFHSFSAHVVSQPGIDIIMTSLSMHENKNC